MSDAEAERRRLVKEAVEARASAEAARVRAEAARREAELDRRRMAFLANAGLRMAGSLDYAAALEGVARAAVPALADLCAVTVLEPRGRVRPLALAHVDPARERIARELVERYPAASTAGMAAVIRRGEPILETYDGAQLAAVATDAEHLRLLRTLAARSSLTVPIRASGRTLGAIALFADTPDRFGDDDLTVATALAARAGLHIENARLYTERAHIADTLQQSLLPAELPAIPGVDLAARYRPAGEQELVGGDFYDVFPTGDDVWTAVIGDASGKGPAAAALTALARHTLYATALREPSPARNLELLNEAMLRRAQDPSAFCTVVYARICPARGSASVTLASGGHPPPFVLRADGTLERVLLPGTLVAGLEHARFQNVDLRLTAGDTLLLYTDGATEVRRSDLELGARELEAALRETVGEPAERVVGLLDARIGRMQEAGPRDDVALLALRILAPDG